MNTRPKHGLVRGGLSLTRIAGVLVVSALFLAGQAVAQSAGDKSKSKQEPKPKPEAKKTSSGCGGVEGPPLTIQPAKPGTKPKYVCANSTITLEPVWSGKPLVFNFKIRNDGDADLRIKAKGG